MNDQGGSPPRGVKRSKSSGRFESSLPGKRKAILVHLDPDLIAQIDQKAAATGESRSVMIGRLLHAILMVEHEEKATPKTILARGKFVVDNQG